MKRSEFIKQICKEITELLDQVKDFDDSVGEKSPESQELACLKEIITNPEMMIYQSATEDGRRELLFFIETTKIFIEEGSKGEELSMDDMFEMISKAQKRAYLKSIELEEDLVDDIKIELTEEQVVDFVFKDLGEKFDISSADLEILKKESLDKLYEDAEKKEDLFSRLFHDEDEKGDE